MREMRIFNINNVDMELPLYQPGDRVTLSESHTISEHKPTGTVEEVSHGGLYIDVKWDEKTIVTEKGIIIFGARRLVNGVVFID